MGIFADLRATNRLGKELAGDWDPAAQMRDGAARMRQITQLMNQQQIDPRSVGELVAAQATVLEATPTGAYINLVPVVTVKLLVTIPGVGPIPAEASTPVPVTELAVLRPGEHIEVKVNPAPPHQVLMPWAAS